MFQVVYKVGQSHHAPARAVEHSDMLAADSHNSLGHLVHQVKAVGFWWSISFLNGTNLFSYKEEFFVIIS